MRTIAIGMLTLALGHGVAAAQSATEQARILRDFDRSVVEYTQRHKCLDVFPEAINAATPAPRIFTLPVAMVFRQMIARSLGERDAATALNGVGVQEHATVFAPYPGNLLYEFPDLLQNALPALPAPLEYRLIGNDLVLRDTEADLIVGVLRDAVGHTLTVRR